MTAIVGVLNSQGVAIAADSAVTVSGKNGKKVYNRSNKIFTLSKYHPVGIAIFNNADFLGIPLETLIKLYRAKIKDIPFRTLKEYKEDFIEFLKSKHSYVSDEFKRDAFYSFCGESYNTIKTNILAKLKESAAEVGDMQQAEASQYIDRQILSTIETHLSFVMGLPKANYVNVSFQDFTTYYRNELGQIVSFLQAEVQAVYEFGTLNADHILKLNQVFYALVNVEFIFERYCGLVFVGFGDDEIYPSSQSALVGTLISDVPRIRLGDTIQIIPGRLNSNILPYVQGDVTTAVLTGVDPNYKSEMQRTIRQAFDTIAVEVSNILNDAKRSTEITSILSDTAEQLIKRMDEYQYNTITGPLLEILAHMGKEDMSELAESLVNITSLKRKFTSPDSSDESVGGPVDVAVITKGDGFIWMKRKQYFNIEDNKGFIDKYYKQ